MSYQYVRVNRCGNDTLFFSVVYYVHVYTNTKQKCSLLSYGHRSHRMQMTFMIGFSFFGPYILVSAVG